VRVERPQARYFRYAGPGLITARPLAAAPRTRSEEVWSKIRRAVIGAPLASEQEIEERLPKRKALAILSSDAISSSAYAPEEIQRVLILGGAAALFLSVDVVIAIAILLTLVAISYRQICYAYPSGGGAYAVAKENLPRIFALVAASALMIDYVMTVAVSTSSAVEQIYSAIPELYPERVAISVACIVLIMLGNLRGIRESGNIFALPTYLFVASALLVIGTGLYRALVLHDPAATGFQGAALPNPVEPVSALLLLRAFAGGSVALTGTEAIANGVPVFKPPESRNAANTLVLMALLLGVIFVGIALVAALFGIVFTDHPLKQSVGALVARAVLGEGWLFYVFQFSTALILILASNTSFNAFPRLAAILAADGYFPRQFGARGDRLAFTTGIVLLALVSTGLMVAFGADTHLLIPLYSVGVFVSFTISQAGMVRHWLAVRGGGWRWRLAVNALGMVLTATVAIVVASVKFTHGAWLVLVLSPVLVLLMLFIRRQYDSEARELAVRQDAVFEGPRRRQRVVIPVPGITRVVVQAVNFARTISTDVRAVHFTDDVEEGERLRVQWERQFPGTPLVVVETPYRQLVNPFLAYLDVMEPDPGAITVVVIPEFVARHWWERYLHNATSARLRRALLGRPDTVVALLPYRRGR
jgi:amino acid transporter